MEVFLLILGCLADIALWVSAILLWFMCNDLLCDLCALGGLVLTIALVYYFLEG